MSEVRRRSVWFWAKIAVVALAIYVASFVGLMGLDARLMTDRELRMFRSIYSPIILAAQKFGR